MFRVLLIFWYVRKYLFGILEDAPQEYKLFKYFQIFENICLKYWVTFLSDIVKELVRSIGKYFSITLEGICLEY